MIIDGGSSASFGAGLMQGFGFIDGIFARRDERKMQAKRLQLEQNQDARAQQQADINTRNQNDAYFTQHADRLGRVLQDEITRVGGEQNLSPEFKSQFHNQLVEIEKQRGGMDATSLGSIARGDFNSDRQQITAASPTFGEFSKQQTVAGLGIAADQEEAANARTAAAQSPAGAAPNPFGPGGSVGPGPVAAAPARGGKPAAPAPAGSTPPVVPDASKTPAVTPTQAVASAFWEEHAVGLTANSRATPTGEPGAPGVFVGGGKSTGFAATDKGVETEQKWSEFASLNSATGAQYRDHVKANPAYAVTAYNNARPNLSDETRQKTDVAMAPILSHRIDELRPKIANGTATPSERHDAQAALETLRLADNDHSHAALLGYKRGDQIPASPELAAKVGATIPPGSPVSQASGTRLSMDKSTILRAAKAQAAPAGAPAPQTASATANPASPDSASPTTNSRYQVPDRPAAAAAPAGPPQISAKLMDAYTRLRMAGAVTDEQYRHFLETGTMRADTIEQLQKLDVTKPYKTYDGKQDQVHIPTVTELASIEHVKIARAQLAETTRHDVQEENLGFARVDALNYKTNRYADARAQAKGIKDMAAQDRNNNKDLEPIFEKASTVLGKDKTVIARAYDAWLGSDAGMEVMRRAGVNTRDANGQITKGLMTSSENKTAGEAFIGWYQRDAKSWYIFDRRETPEQVVGTALPKGQAYNDPAVSGGGGGGPPPGVDAAMWASASDADKQAALEYAQSRR
jgi:hypothetical protein